MRFILVLFIFLSSTQLSWAQQDFKSVLQDSVGADGFIYHRLTRNDNLKRLSKLYGLNKYLIRRMNPILRRGYKKGVLIKLPANAQLIALINRHNATKDKNKYIVQHQDTKFGIAKNYGISIQDLERLNPKIRVGLKEGDTLFVPKAKIQEVLEETDAFFIHLVIKDDTFYSLIRKYNVTQEELELLNPTLVEGLKLGMYLRIPKINTNASPRSLTIFADSIVSGMALKVLFLLPFKTSLDSVPFDNISTASKLRNIVSDFYFGAEQAIDSLSRQGLEIYAEVYDTENNTDTINKLFNTHDLTQFDLVVGPMFTKNISQVSNKLANTDAYIISPFSTAAKAPPYGNAKLIQEVPLQGELTKKMVNYVVKNYTNEKLIIVTDTMPRSEIRLQRILQNLAMNDSIVTDSIVVVKPIDGYVDKDVFQEQIDTITMRKNWVLTLTTDDVLISDAINTLGVLPQESYDITLFSIGKSKALDNLENIYLARLNFFYPSPNYTDFESDAITQFQKAFALRYNNLPTENAFKGFDMVYDALARLARQKNLIDKDYFGVSRRTAHLFDFYQDTTANKILNKGVFLLKYEGLSIKLVE